MATLPVMVTAVAETDGRDRQSIEHIARYIRERGYIQNGKRGAGAPQMNSTDAANFAIALCGSDSPSDAPLAIDRFRSLRPWTDGNAYMIKRYVEDIEALPESLRDMMQCQTFGTALELLIANAAELAAVQDKYLSDVYPDVDELGRATEVLFRRAGLKIEFRRYSASVSLFHTLPDDRQEITFRANYMVDMKRPPGFYGSDPFGTSVDRQIVVTIGLETLLKLHSAITVENKV